MGNESGPVCRKKCLYISNDANGYGISVYCDGKSTFSLLILIVIGYSTIRGCNLPAIIIIRPSFVSWTLMMKGNIVHENIHSAIFFTSPHHNIMSSGPSQCRQCCQLSTDNIWPTGCFNEHGQGICYENGEFCSNYEPLVHFHVILV